MDNLFGSLMKVVAKHEDDLDVLILYSDILNYFSVEGDKCVSDDIIKVMISYVTPEKLALFFAEHNINRSMRFVYDLRDCALSRVTLESLHCMFPNIVIIGLKLDPFNYNDVVIPLELKHLVVIDNHKVSDVCFLVGANVKKLTSIKFDMCDCTLSSYVDTLNLHRLSNYLMLRKCKFVDCTCTAEFFVEFTNALSKCPSLEVLYVEDIYFVVKENKKFVLCCRKLKRLNMWMFSNVGEKIELSLEGCTKLRKLKVSSNFNLQLGYLRELRCVEIVRGRGYIYDVTLFAECKGLKYLDVGKFKNIIGLDLLKGMRYVVVAKNMVVPDLKGCEIRRR